MQVSRELVVARRIRAILEAENAGAIVVRSGKTVVTGSGIALERGALTTHLLNLIDRAARQKTGHLDQTLLLKSVASQLRAREKIGVFVSEALLRLALLGTAIGFILMLVPIAALSAFDADTLRTALAGMTSGMAVALNVTVSGIACALILKFQYYQLDGALTELFDSISDTSEIYVVPALSGEPMHDPSLFDGSDDGTFVPFTDILFNALLGFAIMVFIAFALVRPNADTGNIESKAEMIITVNWPDNDPNDIDTYVQDPTGQVTWYHAMQNNFVTLDRDDRGDRTADMIVDGKVIHDPVRQETVTVRKLVPGEYIVNINRFTAPTPQPVPVTVKVEKVNPKLTIAYRSTLLLDHKGDEKTVVRFTIDAAGNVVDLNTRPTSLIQAVRK